ncbi:hypothetical protein SRHO_G00276580 [Serrasalmus rhombeus]
MEAITEGPVESTASPHFISLCSKSQSSTAVILDLALVCNASVCKNQPSFCCSEPPAAALCQGRSQSHDPVSALGEEDAPRALLTRGAHEEMFVSLWEAIGSYLMPVGGSMADIFMQGSSGIPNPQERCDSSEHSEGRNEGENVQTL